ncbi:MAG: hypothetical protein AAFN10_20110, partial [Bacteroidota bacterium]
RITSVGKLSPTYVIRIGAFLSMNSQKGQLRSKLIYPNGMESFGMESSYNGIFDLDQLDLGYGFALKERIHIPNPGNREIAQNSNMKYFQSQAGVRG